MAVVIQSVLAGGLAPLLAQDAAEGPSMFGWGLGFGIGLAVVVVVVVVVSAILFFAARIRRQADAATEALETAYRHTMPLWEVSQTNLLARDVLAAARNARKALGG